MTSYVTMEFRGFQSRNFDVHGKNDFTHLSVNRFQCSLNRYNRQKYFYISLNSRWNLSWNDDFATGWSRCNFYAIFLVNRYAYCVWLLHKYEAHIKGLPICFSEVQVKNDVTDNNNKHFVTAFEGECRNIIELRERLKLCFLIILSLPLPTHWQTLKLSDQCQCWFTFAAVISALYCFEDQMLYWKNAVRFDIRQK